jgi:DNA-binding MarR family transcriptional regulator
MTRNSIHALQRYYPQIYLACHVDHVRTKSNRHHLSAHDSSLLAHLDEKEPAATGRLARHLGVANSTLSATLKRLEALGHVTRTPDPRDRRKIGVCLTPKGAEAMADASVLDGKRVAAVLAELSPAEQSQAIDGLALLARAARFQQARAPRRKRW